MQQSARWSCLAVYKQAQSQNADPQLIVFLLQLSWQRCATRSDCFRARLLQASQNPQEGPCQKEACWTALPVPRLDRRMKRTRIRLLLSVANSGLVLAWLLFHAAACYECSTTMSTACCLPTRQAVIQGITHFYIHLIPAEDTRQIPCGGMLQQCLTSTYAKNCHRT